MTSRLALGLALSLTIGCGSTHGPAVDSARTDAAARVDGDVADALAVDADLDAGGIDDAATDLPDTDVPDASFRTPDAAFGPPDAAMPPPLGEVPGGPDGTAPIVGCTDAERPARYSASSTPNVCEASAPARCWYVATDGHDGAMGTFADPFLRPQEAVRGAGPGDFIYLRGGVYGTANAYIVAPRNWSDPTAGVVRRLIRLGRVQTPAWSTNETWTTPNGVTGAPITVRSYPGERACADGTGGVEIGVLGTDTHDWNIEDLTLRGNSIYVEGGSRGTGTTAIHQTHDIAIRRDEVYGVVGPRTSNVGLIRIDRGDWGGPYEITVESNILHDLSVDEGTAGILDWRTTTDAQHFGAVTTLSCESYITPYGACGGNGRLVVRNNLIHDVPSAFFFKNPTVGPVEVTENLIHDVRMLGHWSPSYITFEHNTVWAARGSAHIGGFGGDTSPPVYMISGRHFVARFNTIVGMTAVFAFDVYGGGHTITDNVVVGLSSDATMGSYNTPGYTARTGSEASFPDTGCMPSDLSMSELATSTLDRECFVTTHASFIASSRYCQTATGWNISWLDLAHARTTFGHHAASVVVTDPHAVFVDYDARDYRVLSSGPCAGHGAHSDAP